MSRAMLFLSLFLAAMPVTASAKPQRIVSINLCSDILVLELAPHDVVKSVFRLAADPEDSPVSALVKNIPLNNATAEEILLYRPDLVLAHSYSSPFTLQLLQRAHVKVVQVKDASSFEDIRDNVRSVAAAVGEVEKGEAWIARFDAKLESSKRPFDSNSPRAIIYQDLGGAAASNTILGALLNHSGFRNAVITKSDANFVNLTIEDVIDLRPDLVAVGVYRVNQPSLAHAQLNHPALHAYISQHAHAAELPAQLWTCGTPFITGIADRLAAARDRFGAGEVR